MWQKSRNWTARFGPALFLALVACSLTCGQDVRTNYMPGTDFSKYHTYAWVDEVKGVPRVGGQPDRDQAKHDQNQKRPLELRTEDVGRAERDDHRGHGQEHVGFHVRHRTELHMVNARLPQHVVEVRTRLVNCHGRSLCGSRGKIMWKRAHISIGPSGRGR